MAGRGNEVRGGFDNLKGVDGSKREASVSDSETKELGAPSPIAKGVTATKFAVMIVATGSAANSGRAGLDGVEPRSDYIVHQRVPSELRVLD